MLTVHFKDRAERDDTDPPFWHDPSILTDPSLQADFAHSEELIDNGFGGIVTFTKTRTATVYENSFVADENAYHSFLAAADADTRLKNTIDLSQTYYNENGITRIVEVKYFDESGNEVLDPF